MRLSRYIELSAQSAGLNRDSVILLEQIPTIDKPRLKERMGYLDESTMSAIDAALAVSLGLSREAPIRKNGASLWQNPFLP